MIIIRIQGGLGNQMFEYASGRGIAKKTGQDLKFDLSGLNTALGDTKRYYQLNIFNAQPKFASQKELKRFTLKKHFPNISALLKKIGVDIPSYVIEKNVNFNEKNFSVKCDAYLDGYWQSEKYFKDIENIIREDFTLKNKLNDSLQEITEKVKNLNSISIHIRRGDYANNPKTNSQHGLCPIEYYNQAIKKMVNKVKNPVFFVFSDDINWAKNNLKTDFPTTFINGNKDYEDLILISLCKHNIIANSSFSWWGAWLNKNTNKIVITPKKWFLGLDCNIEDRLPLEWIKI